MKYLCFILYISISFVCAQGELFIKRLEVNSKKENGKAWDSFGGKPDILVEIDIWENRWKKVFKMKTHKNTYTITEKTKTDIQVNVDDVIKVAVYDKDLSSNDRIGEKEITITKDMLHNAEYTVSFEAVAELQLVFSLQNSISPQHNDEPQQNSEKNTPFSSEENMANNLHESEEREEANNEEMEDDDDEDENEQPQRRPVVVDNGPAPIELLVMAKVIKNNGHWFTPLNSNYNKVALFSKQRDSYQIMNKSDQPVTINDIYLERDPGVANEEFTLQEYHSTKSILLKFKPVVIAPKKSYSFYLRFYPVHSYERKAKIIINYNSDRHFICNVTGKGRDNAKFFSHGSLDFHKLLGGKNTDEMAGTMVADRDGNMYFNAHVTQILDKFAFDIIVGKVTTDGKLAWAKFWHGPYRDFGADPGQNGASGGGANSMVIDEDGYLYVLGATSSNKNNSMFSALVLKIDPQNGEIIWEKVWRPKWGEKLAKNSVMPYAIDVKNGKVYVTGELRTGVLLLTLNAADGSIDSQYSIHLHAKSVDRGYAIKVNSADQVYISGIANNKGFLLKFSEKKKKLLWAKQLNVGWGSNINALDMDSSGNLYLSVNSRGAKTTFAAVKMDQDGQTLWAKAYNSRSSNDSNNTNVVKVVGEDVYVGGRVGLGYYDAQMGDALLLKLNTNNGDLRWASFYYTGKGPDEIGEHRIKGIAASGNSLYLFGQVYTGNYNGYRYWGYWYDGVEKLTKYNVSVSPLQPEDFVTYDNTTKDAASLRKYVDISKMVYQDADVKNDGHGPDGDLIFWKLNTK